MAISGGMRDERIELRASREQKRLLGAALPAAEEIVARNERITLSERDALRVSICWNIHRLLRPHCGQQREGGGTVRERDSRLARGSA